MGMTLKELLTKGEGTLSAQEAKALAAQCRMDVDTLYTLLEERGIKVLEEENEPSLDVDSIIAEVENAENNNDDMGLADENEEDAEENPADLKAAMDELLDDPVKNYLKQIGQIPLLSAEQEVELSRRIHAGAEAAHILQADRQKYGAPEYIKKNSARFSFEEDENSRSYTEDLDEDGEKSAEDAEEKADEEKAMEAVENSAGITLLRVIDYDLWTGQKKAAATRSNHATEGFDDFWDLYHRITQKDKINIARARKEWKKLTATEKKLALENIEEYYAHQKDIRFCKQAATYLADKAFLNEYEF